MSVKDLIKNSVLKSANYTTTDAWKITWSLIIALILGVLIFYIYKRFYGGVLFSKSFAVTLIGMCVLTCMVTLAISTNIVISLGMVGALSIVRYRTAIKDPMDLLYLFWSITGGITCGAGMYVLTIAASAILIVMIAIFYGRPANGKIYVAVIHYAGQKAGDDCIRAFGKNKYRIKSKTLRNGITELAVELFIKGDNFTFEERIRNIDDVKDVTLIQYNGEYNG